MNSVTSVAFTGVKLMKVFWIFFLLLKLGLSFTKLFHLGVCISDIFVGLHPQVPSMIALEWCPSLTWSLEDYRAVLLKPYSTGLMGVTKTFSFSLCVDSFSVTPGEMFSDGAVSRYVVLGALGNRLQLC